MPLLHPSGGLVYHLRAWRYGPSLWSDFHGRVRAWLAGWRPGTEHLVLVGPSGGYALDLRFLQGFPRVTVLEPDRLARVILERRFPGVPFRFDKDPGLARADGFSRLAARYPEGAFLFCNLLGQSPVGQDADFRHRAWLSGLEAALAGHAWASWHDLASTGEPPDETATTRLERAAPLESVLECFWRGERQKPLTIHDHECGGILPDAPREYTVWELRPGRYHVVEWLGER